MSRAAQASRSFDPRRWTRVNHESTADCSGLDALASMLDRENTQLRNLEYRLNNLRHALIDGDADFVRTAAAEAETAAATAAAAGEPREAARYQAMTGLGLDPATPLATLPDLVPSPHRELLARLVRELVGRARAIRVQRDAVRTLADEGRRALSSVLHLDAGPTGPAIDLESEAQRGTLFVGEF